MNLHRLLLRRGVAIACLIILEIIDDKRRRVGRSPKCVGAVGGEVPAVRSDAVDPIADPGLDADHIAARKAVRRHGVRLARHVEVTNDAAILLAAGTPDGWGVALVSGTGSIAFGRAPDGRTARGGGWGYLLGDEGSAYALVLAGLQAVARAADGRGEPTCLT